MELPKVYTECAHGNTCISPNIIEKIKKELHIPGGLTEIKEKLNCKDSESCVLTNPEIKEIIGEKVARNEINTKLKPYGPQTDKWFSNEHIDNILKQWSIKEFPNFYPYEFAMIDFMKINHDLVKIPPQVLYDGGKRCFACVVNTDRSSGGGQHWMALFGDMRDDNKWTVEFFNSSGRVYEAISEYLAFAVNSLHDLVANWKDKPEIKSIIASKIVHQQSNTECGPYSIYYIWSRLHGVPYTKFGINRIPDEKMYEFRKVLFRDNR